MWGHIALAGGHVKGWGSVAIDCSAVSPCSDLGSVGVVCHLPPQRPFELVSKEQQQAQLQQQPQHANSGRIASSSLSSSPGPHLLLSRQQLAAQQQQVLLPPLTANLQDR